MPQDKGLSKRKLLMAVIALLCSGVTLSIIQKYQNKTKGLNGRIFDHPFFQASLNSVAETFAFVLYFIKIKWFKEKTPKDLLFEVEEAEKPTKPKVVYLAIPESFDTVETALKNVSLTYISASVTQMLRSSTIIFCTLLSVIFLKKIFYRHHWSSLGVIVVGVFLVGLSYLMSATTGDNTSFAGIAILLVGQFFGSAGYIVEEKFFGDFDLLDPFILVGYEGLWGSLIWIIVLPILQFIPCNIDSICTNGVVEDTYGAFLDYGANPVLIVQSVSLIFLVALFNVAGVHITKYGSAAQRTTVDCSRNFFVWIYFLIIPVYGSYLEEFRWLQLFGFIILCIGILMFNEIIVIPYCGFNRYTAKAFKQMEATQEKKKIKVGRSTGLNDSIEEDETQLKEDD